MLFTSETQATSYACASRQTRLVCIVASHTNTCPHTLSLSLSLVSHFPYYMDTLNYIKNFFLSVLLSTPGWISAIALSVWKRGSEVLQSPPLREAALLHPQSEEGDDPSIRDFRDKLNRCSEKEIIRQCQGLNGEISSTVLTIIDKWAQSRDAFPLVHQSHSANAVNLSPKCQKYLLFVLGRKTYDSIKDARSSPASSKCEVRMTAALHAYAAHFTFRVISETFCPGLSLRKNKEICRIFKRMLDSEPQATALRCQALMFTYAKKGLNGKKTLADLQEKLSNSFDDIFVLAGENRTSPFLPKMRHLIVESEIVETALRLTEIFRTCFFSVHLDVFLIRPPQAFDSRFMTVANSSRKADPLDTIPVLCTIGLGVREVPSAQHAFGKTMTGGRVLLKPKVLVEVS
ncbi:hypothetical protein DFH11DRAFT_1808134, partial [Phellopilus nigrolimitatus]